MYLIAVVTSIVGSILIMGVFIYYRKTMQGSAASEISEKSARITEVVSQMESLAASGEQFGSKAQLQTLLERIEEGKAGLLKEKENLKDLESKLDSVQKAVEGKEVQHQEIKAAKEEDENKLSELLANYEQISQESISLEQKLAASLKSLDALMSGVQLTTEQRSVLEELSNTLTSAGSRMRDLVTEYNLVKERLEALSLQHKDLEEEYTRLVEKQLGE